MSVTRVLIEAEFDQEQPIAAVEEVLARWGIRQEVRAEIPLYGGVPEEPLIWIIGFTLSVPVSSFLSSFGGEAGKDAYTAVKQFIRDLIQSRRASGSPGQVFFDDSDGTRLEIAEDVSDEALDALGETDWNRLRGSHVVIWDPECREWRDRFEGFS